MSADEPKVETIEEVKPEETKHEEAKAADAKPAEVESDDETPAGEDGANSQNF
jgi:hypothetical protein